MVANEDVERADRAIAEGDARLTLVADKQVYRLGEDVQLQAVLANTSNVAFYLDRRIGWNGGMNDFVLLARDAESNEALPRGWGGSFTSPPRSRDDFVKLDPGQVFGERRAYPMRDMGILRRGTYELTVEYVSVLTKEEALGLPVWLPSRDHPLISNTVVIVVRD
ncbi:MAG: hypothetical protein IT184_16625 [Acidobacteria bacterium]|nr:hypothetical protein [Acidobacteriota bacterium]